MTENRLNGWPERVVLAVGNDYWARLSREQRAEIVKCLVERLGMSVGQVAKMAGVSPGAVSLWLKGERTPSPEN
ncbi:MAG: helix-turn-helix domain-containing protein, partial [Infirmifilum sp.]